MKKKILVALQSFGEFSDAPIRLLQDAEVDIVFNRMGHRLNQSEIIQLGQGCDGVIAGVEPYDERVLTALTHLKCISRSGVGVDNIDLEFARQRGITILNTPDIVIQPVAEMTLAMIFDMLRLLTFHTNLLKSGQWNKRAGYLLSGRKVGIIGLGRNGKRVAEMLNALNAQVYGSDLFPDMAWAEKYGVNITSIQTLLEISDVLCLHVSVSKEHPFVLGRAQMAHMKEGAIIINTSRGNVVDETALYEALKSGHLGGAALDVFNNEPYQGPLCELDNVVLTPHISTLTHESRAEMETQAVVNILNFFNDR